MVRKKTWLLAVVGAALAGSGTLTGVKALVPEPLAEPERLPAADGDYARTVQAMKPPKRARPVVAVLGDNRGTEAIDFLVPYAVLSQSDAADVFAVALRGDTLQLRPALAVRPHMSSRAFDSRYPDGADYVVVPAMRDHETPEIIAWIRAQAARGATIVAVCAGAEILANAGLLKGRQATTHWASVRTILAAEPTARWVPHRRYVADRGIVTTTGVSAAVPMSLALVEAIAGRGRAATVARELGVSDWERDHDSNAYRLGGEFWTGLYNMLTGWGVEELAIPVEDGVNDIALALAADAWSRTYRSKAVTLASSRTVQTRFGLDLVVDRQDRRGIDAVLPPVDSPRPARALDGAFDQIAKRYGASTMKLVAVQLEHERGARP